MTEDPEARMATAGDDTERRLHQVWTELLGRERVGRTENFFDVGGHSLLLIDLQECIAAEFGHGLELLDLFRNPTIAALAALLDSTGPVPATETQATDVVRPARADALADLRRRRQANE